jgi:hypothetical protein
MLLAKVFALEAAFRFEVSTEGTVHSGRRWPADAGTGED